MLALLFLLILLVPIVEIWAILAVGGMIGGWQTAALLLAVTVLGGWIVRREGRRAWHTLQDAVRRGVPPDRELADGALVLAGGILLLTPGFVTDVFGLVLVLPLTRPLLRALLLRRLQAAALASAGSPGIQFPGARFPGARPDPRSPAGAGPGSRAPGGPVIVTGEVIRDEPGEPGSAP